MGMRHLKYMFANEPPTCLALAERISCMAAETIKGSVATTVSLLYACRHAWKKQTP
jgi:hypothetical protein